MTPQELRGQKTAMVYTPESGDELMKHPLVTSTPQGGVIVAMAVNLILEEIAQHLEKEENDQ